MRGLLSTTAACSVTYEFSDMLSPVLDKILSYSLCPTLLSVIIEKQRRGSRILNCSERGTAGRPAVLVACAGVGEAQTSAAEEQSIISRVIDACDNGHAILESQSEPMGAKLTVR